MSPSKMFAAAALLLAASPATAKTDIGGCVSSDTVINDGRSGPYMSRVWYVPGTGEVCEILDCGGGRAPPKTNVPGCPGYKGSETYSPSYLVLSTAAAEPEPTATTEAEAVETTTEAAKGGNKASYEATLTEAAKTTLSTAVAESESAAASSSNGTVTSAPVYSTPASGSSGSGSGSGSDATTTPAASTAGAASMSAGGALVALMAGAAAFAML